MAVDASKIRRLTAILAIAVGSDVLHLFAVENEKNMDDDEITTRRKIPKIVGYTEQVVPSLQDREFQRHFRLHI